MHDSTKPMARAIANSPAAPLIKHNTRKCRNTISVITTFITGKVDPAQSEQDYERDDRWRQRVGRARAHHSYAPTTRGSRAARKMDGIGTGRLEARST